MGAWKPYYVRYFYPRSPCGERPFRQLQSALRRDFYPRSPCGERQVELNGTASKITFLSTLSLRRATHFDNYNLHCVEISIHALLAESDHPVGVLVRIIENFYPRSPCGERQHFDNYNLHCVEISIHALLAESDYLGARKPHYVRYFYPRSPCGERRVWACSAGSVYSFLSTLSLRRATHFDNYNLHCVEISIHALLAESDSMGLDGRFKL